MLIILTWCRCDRRLCRCLSCRKSCRPCCCCCFRCCCCHCCFRNNGTRESVIPKRIVCEKNDTRVYKDQASFINLSSLSNSSVASGNYAQSGKGKACHLAATVVCIVCITIYFWFLPCEGATQQHKSRDSWYKRAECSNVEMRHLLERGGCHGSSRQIRPKEISLIKQFHQLNWQRLKYIQTKQVISSPFSESSIIWRLYVHRFWK